MNHSSPRVIVALFALTSTVAVTMAGCGDAGPGKAIEPDEKTACADAGSRVTVTGYFLAGDVAFCGDKGDCIGHLVSEVGPSTQGLPMKRLQATAAVGSGKNQVKAIPGGGMGWRSTTSHDAEGKAVAQPAKFSGKLKKTDEGCTLAVDRIDSPTAAAPSSAK